MGDPIAPWQGGICRPHAVAVDPPATRADEQRPGVTEQPRPEPAPLEHEACSGVQLTRAVTKQVPEQACGNPLGLRRVP